jgi:4-diphosphocytidyl-2-C-methyl-D-erythritol kinase
MIFERDYSSTALAVRSLEHFQIGATRLFSVLSDPASWNQDLTPRILSKSAPEKIVYSFDGKERATISFVSWSSELTELQIQIESFSDLESLSAQERYWSTVLDSVSKRLGQSELVVASSPAKVNLYFAVGRFLKNGYHEVASCYHALSLRERVATSLAQSFSIELSGPYGGPLGSGIPTDESNLVYRATTALAGLSTAVRPELVEFHIHKEIPVAGGMAGGSADAAAALVAVNELFSASLDGELTDVGKGLGADVPFALQGGTQIGLGVGDRLTKVDTDSIFHLVVTPNSSGLSTPQVYKQLDILRIQEGIDVSSLEVPEVPAELIEAIKSGDPLALAPLMANDLERAAISLLPELEKTLSAGLKAGALRSMISGSGPSVIHLTRDRLDAELVANRLNQAGFPSIACFSSLSGTRLEK